MQTFGQIVALAGGVGAARFLAGLAAVVDPARITVIGNVGDDLEWHGLHVSPDLDTVVYMLAGLSDEVRGWGLHDETFVCSQTLSRYRMEDWFKIGDRDFATHLFRTEALRHGATLSEATARICESLGVRSRLLPVTDDRLRTRVTTDEGVLDFQNYFVQRACEPQVRGIAFDGAESARPAPGVIEAIAEAAAVLICPSNPIISIGPILEVRGVRQALRDTRAKVAAISPIVGGRALKGPADRMMRGLGLDSSAPAVAALYRDFVDVFVIDRLDEDHAAQVEGMNMKAVVTDTVMKDHATRTALAATTLGGLGL